VPTTTPFPPFAEVAACLAMLLGIGSIVLQDDAATRVPPPDALVKAVSLALVAAADSEADPAGAAVRFTTVDKRILPFVGVERIAADLAGPYWEQASSEQRRQLLREVKVLITRECAEAAQRVRGHTVGVEAAIGTKDPMTLKSIVRAEFASPAHRVPVEFRLERRLVGWQIRDIRLGDVWFGERYRQVFARELAVGGIDGLIAGMRRESRRVEASR
jgi:phospholipid transport system substrate-binding protein